MWCIGFLHDVVCQYGYAQPVDSIAGYVVVLVVVVVVLYLYKGVVVLNVVVALFWMIVVSEWSFDFERRLVEG